MGKSFFKNLLCCLISGVALLSMSGCTSSDIKAYNAKLRIEIENIDELLSGISDAEKKFVSLEIELTSHEVDLEKPVVMKLTNVNDFSESVYLAPGEYTISSYKFKTPSAVPYECENLAEKNLSVKAENTEKLAVKMKRLANTEPLKEIINAENYTERIQIDGKLYDIRTLDQYIEFDFDRPANKRVPAVKIAGLYAIYNKKQEIIGVQIENPNCFIFGGICVGMEISEIANKENGIIGLPSHGMETPVFFDLWIDTEYLFVDSKSGARVEAVMNKGFTSIESIKFMLGEEGKR